MGLENGRVCWSSKGAKLQQGARILPGYGTRLKPRWQPRVVSSPRGVTSQPLTERLTAPVQCCHSRPGEVRLSSAGSSPAGPVPCGAHRSSSTGVPSVRAGSVHPVSVGGLVPPFRGPLDGLPPFPPLSPALRAAASARSRRKMERSGRSPRSRCPGSAVGKGRRQQGAGRLQAPRPAAPRRPLLTPHVLLQGPHAAAHRRRAQREQAARSLLRHRRAQCRRRAVAIPGRSTAAGPAPRRRHLERRLPPAAILGRSRRRRASSRPGLSQRPGSDRWEGRHQESRERDSRHLETVTSCFGSDAPGPGERT